MSMPISKCLFEQAALGDEAAYSRLLEKMAYNRRWGGGCIIGSNEPTSGEHATDQQMDALMQRLENDLKGVKSRWEEVGLKYK